MTWTDPWPVNDLERRRLERRLSALVGQRIEGVRYLVPSTSEDQGTGNRADVHEVSMGLEIETASTVFVVAWKMSGALEGLSFGLFPQKEHRRSSQVWAFDVGETAQWRPCLEVPIAQIGTAWHIPEARCPESLWSIRLGFESGAAATACLGELGSDDSLRYQPDGLLVIFGRAIAEEFRIPAGTTAALGKAIGGNGQ